MPYNTGLSGKKDVEICLSRKAGLLIETVDGIHKSNRPCIIADGHKKCCPMSLVLVKDNGPNLTCTK